MCTATAGYVSRLPKVHVFARLRRWTVYVARPGEDYMYLHVGTLLAMSA